MIPAPLDEALPPASRSIHMPPGGVGLRVPGTLAYRHLAIRLVTTACRAALDGEPSDIVADDTFTHEVVSAFGEAFNNVALHGYGDGAPGAIRVEVAWDEEKLVVMVMDGGRTFDLDNVSLPDLDAMQESGMGVFIMRACMDEVDYQPGPPNVLRMVKRRQPAGGRALRPDDVVAEVEQSAWRMKAVSSFTTGSTPMPPEMDERMAEGSRRR